MINDEKERKILVFGSGEVFLKRINEIDDEIVGLVDNDEKKWGTVVRGVRVYAPKEAIKLQFEYIVIMSSKYAVEIRNQLLALGYSEKIILHYGEYFAKKSFLRNKIVNTKRYKEKKCLIITNELGYHGGALAALYLATALQRLFEDIIIVAASGEEKFINEFSQHNIKFEIYPYLEYAKWEELEWVDSYDAIIVNTYPMILCAIEIAKYRKVVLWLHESQLVYDGMLYWREFIKKNILIENLSIFAVSEVARDNFVRNVKEIKIGLLPYGIVDERTSEAIDRQVINFAIVGIIHPSKQQHLFVQAARKLNEVCASEVNYYVIGKTLDFNYYDSIKKECLGVNNIVFTGELSRVEMKEIYKKIDVFVIASSAETMSLVATEAMMMEKICIVCDVAGMAKYIKSGQNGFLFKTNDLEELVVVMEQCVKNKSRLNSIKLAARKTYEDNFSMDKLFERICDIRELL